VGALEKKAVLQCEMAFFRIFERLFQTTTRRRKSDNNLDDDWFFTSKMIG
jgi:hypothetical protein